LGDIRPSVHQVYKVYRTEHSISLDFFQEELLLEEQVDTLDPLSYTWLSFF